MKLNEFVNKQKNIISSAQIRRVDKSIITTEERNQFFSGELFKKYDLVESNSQIFRILEKCSNYYLLADKFGNIVRKFEKQLKLIESGNRQFCDLKTLTLHGYKPSKELLESKQASQLRRDINRLLESSNNDDIAVLKELKQTDKQIQEDMNTLKDKLTIAKIIADACGVPHDHISSPENLIANSIRKAKSNPALMKNKEILGTMLQTAKEAGIKFKDNTFGSTDVSESINDDDYYVLHKSTKKIVKNLGKQHVPQYQNPDEVLKHHLPDDQHTIMRGMQAKRIVEHIIKTPTGYKLVSKKTGKNLGTATSLAAIKKREAEVEYFKHQNESQETNEDLRSFVRTKTLGLIRANIQKNNHDDFAKQHEKMSADAYRNGNTKSGDAHKAASGRHARASKRTNDAYEKYEASK